MNNIKIIVSPIIILLFCSSCTTVVNFSEPNQPNPIYDVQKLNVLPDQKLLSLNETGSSYGLESHYEVWRLVKRLFDEKSNSSYKISLQHNDFNISSSDVLIFGTRWDANYSLILTLSNETKKAVINVTGNGTSMADPSIAGEKAIENTLFKVHKLTKIYLDSWNSINQ